MAKKYRRIYFLIKKGRKVSLVIVVIFLFWFAACSMREFIVNILLAYFAVWMITGIVLYVLKYYIAEKEIRKLNKDEFKKIKLKKQDEYFSNLFDIEAKIHSADGEIVILKFGFNDEDVYWEAITYCTMEYLEDNIGEVVEEINIK